MKKIILDDIFKKGGFLTFLSNSEKLSFQLDEPIAEAMSNKVIGIDENLNLIHGMTEDNLYYKDKKVNLNLIYEYILEIKEKWFNHPDLKNHYFPDICIVEEKSNSLGLVKLTKENISKEYFQIFLEAESLIDFQDWHKMVIGHELGHHYYRSAEIKKDHKIKPSKWRYLFLLINILYLYVLINCFLENEFIGAIVIGTIFLFHFCISINSDINWQKRANNFIEEFYADDFATFINDIENPKLKIFYILRSGEFHPIGLMRNKRLKNIKNLEDIKIFKEFDHFYNYMYLDFKSNKKDKIYE